MLSEATGVNTEEGVNTTTPLWKESTQRLATDGRATMPWKRVYSARVGARAAGIAVARPREADSSREGSSSDEGGGAPSRRATIAESRA